MMFCTECGNSLTSAAVEIGLDEEPYVVWKGFPFAWLKRVSQTKTQYFISLGMVVFSLSLAFLIIMSIVVPAALRGESGAGDVVLFFTLLYALFSVLIWITWRVGRKRAKEEKSQREGDL
jgi:hypothetical protein